MLNNILEFVGRTHLVVLHFPIALIVCAAIVESSRLLWLRASRRSIADQFRLSSSASVMLALGLASTVVAVITGLVFGFDYSDAVDLHRILGLVSGALVVITSVVLLIARRKKTTKPALVYIFLLCISAVAVSITGHFGGNLTHGEGFLTQPLKDIFIEPLAPQAQEHNISNTSLETYNTIIQPLFNDGCIKCHGPKKQKGDIRLDSLSYTLDPDAGIVERGSPDASELIYRLHLPQADEDAMPPEGKGDPFTDEQIQSIESWITSLAP